MSPDATAVRRVLLVDDHRLVRAGLAGLVAGDTGLEVCGEAANGEQAVALAATTSPDVVLMDLSMPVMDGVAATRAILADAPDTRILVLTSFADHDRVREALAAGAVGYLLKDSEPGALLAAVRAAADGQVPLDPRVAGALLPGASSPAPPAEADVDLSRREREVLELVGQGLANKQIARCLGITERTVKAHVGSIFRRIGVADRTSAALWARDHLG
ncbi:response regulator transcription factor [Nocardioides sp. CFH 31398]|uniref:response regulator n=1 Tax=Nocardioides sp. CFH 31398 TaxID=2919579 RepID=UPI001F0568AB|nr:response regulator transcription factor [Nocardioides sp. CFH 31398]MCH1866372.1 response regulator transcription factor [Nocardioides sp. CFH 31398]